MDFNAERLTNYADKDYVKQIEDVLKERKEKKFVIQHIPLLSDTSALVFESENRIIQKFDLKLEALKTEIKKEIKEEMEK